MQGEVRLCWHGPEVRCWWRKRSGSTGTILPGIVLTPRHTQLMHELAAEVSPSERLGITPA